MGKRGPKPEDLSGRTFNMLTAIHRVEKEHPRYIKHFEGVQWFCGCECGNYTVARSADLKSGHTKSCGCLRGKNVQDAEKYKQMVEGFWEWVDKLYEIEPREYFENYCKNWEPPNPMLVALHHIWKRDTKMCHGFSKMSDKELLTWFKEKLVKAEKYALAAKIRDMEKHY